MYAVVKLVRDCSNCPPEVLNLSDEQIFEVLQLEIDGMQLLDVLVEIGCEVVVEEIVEWLRSQQT